jgi:hypothetical protein
MFTLLIAFIIALLVIRFAAHIIAGVLNLVTWVFTAIIWLGFWIMSAGVISIAAYIGFVLL